MLSAAQSGTSVPHSCSPHLPSAAVASVPVSGHRQPTHHCDRACPVSPGISLGADVMGPPFHARPHRIARGRLARRRGGGRREVGIVTPTWVDDGGQHRQARDPTWVAVMRIVSLPPEVKHATSLPPLTPRHSVRTPASLQPQ